MPARDFLGSSRGASAATIGAAGGLGGFFLPNVLGRGGGVGTLAPAGGAALLLFLAPRASLNRSLLATES